MGSNKKVYDVSENPQLVQKKKVAMKKVQKKLKVDSEQTEYVFGNAATEFVGGLVESVERSVHLLHEKPDIALSEQGAIKADLQSADE